MNGEPRSDRLATLVADAGLDQLLVGDLVRPGESGSRRDGANLRWLTGFSGQQRAGARRRRASASSSRTSATRSGPSVRSTPSSSAW